MPTTWQGCGSGNALVHSGRHRRKFANIYLHPGLNRFFSFF
jgi:hypothetical protein